MKKTKIINGIKNGLFGIGIALVLSTPIDINFLCNNKTIKTPSYSSVSSIKGLFGHTEYVKYADNSQEFKIYNGLGHKYQESTLAQDLNGDGLVDRIRINGSEFSFNRLKKTLVRSLDYNTNKKDFDGADMTLNKLKEKASKK